MIRPARRRRSAQRRAEDCGIAGVPAVAQDDDRGAAIEEARPADAQRLEALADFRPARPSTVGTRARALERLAIALPRERIRNAHEPCAERERLDARERVLERVEHLQQESAVQVHRPRHVAERRRARVRRSLRCRRARRIGSPPRREGESDNAPRGRAARRAARCAIGGSRRAAQPPDDQRRGLLERRKFVTRVVPEVLRRWLASRVLGAASGIVSSPSVVSREDAHLRRAPSRFRAWGSSNGAMTGGFGVGDPDARSARPGLRARSPPFFEQRVEDRKVVSALDEDRAKREVDIAAIRCVYCRRAREPRRCSNPSRPGRRARAATAESGDEQARGPRMPSLRSHRPRRRASRAALATSARI